MIIYHLGCINKISDKDLAGLSFESLLWGNMKAAGCCIGLHFVPVVSIVFSLLRVFHKLLSGTTWFVHHLL